MSGSIDQFKLKPLTLAIRRETQHKGGFLGKVFRIVVPMALPFIAPAFFAMPTSFLGKFMVNAAMGGISSKLAGGKFGRGALIGGAASLVSSGITGLKNMSFQPGGANVASGATNIAGATSNIPLAMRPIANTQTARLLSQGGIDAVRGVAAGSTPGQILSGTGTQNAGINDANRLPVSPDGTTAHTQTTRPDLQPDTADFSDVNSAANRARFEQLSNANRVDLSGSGQAQVDVNSPSTTDAGRFKRFVAKTGSKFLNNLEDNPQKLVSVISGILGDEMTDLTDEEKRLVEEERARLAEQRKLDRSLFDRRVETFEELRRIALNQFDPQTVARRSATQAGLETDLAFRNELRKRRRTGSDEANAALEREGAIATSKNKALAFRDAFDDASSAQFRATGTAVNALPVSAPDSAGEVRLAKLQRDFESDRRERAGNIQESIGSASGLFFDDSDKPDDEDKNKPQLFVFNEDTQQFTPAPA